MECVSKCLRLCISEPPTAIEDRIARAKKNDLSIFQYIQRAKTLVDEPTAERALSPSDFVLENNWMVLMK